MKRYAYPALLSVAVLGGCAKSAPQAEDTRPVRYAVLGHDDGAATQQFAGVVRASHETELAFRVGGKVVAKLVDNGQHVHKGQPLARLDAQDFALDQSAKSAQLAAAESDLAQQDTDLKRSRDLLARQFISQAQYDRQLNGVNAARAKLKEARAQLSASSNQASYTTLTADADGTVSDLALEPGQVVAAGQPVAHLSADGAREVAIQVAEQDLAKVRNAKHFVVQLWANGQNFDGQLRELSANADPATRTYAARITVAAPATALTPGMTATVRLPAAGDQQARRLPLTALLDENGQHYLWTVDAKSQKVSRVKVDVAAVGDDWAAIQGGPANGSLVVTAGVHLLRDGQRVKLLAN
jgi:RND family efflux transporter MFP subunit